MTRHELRAGEDIFLLPTKIVVTSRCFENYY